MNLKFISFNLIVCFNDYLYSTGGGVSIMYTNTGCAIPYEAFFQADDKS